MRRALLLALLLAAASACGDSGEEDCPGEPVAELGFSGTRILAGNAALSGLDPVPAVPDCVPVRVDFPVAKKLPPFRATLAADGFTQAAALCRPGRAVLFGQRTGSRYVVEARTGGATLPPACSAALRLVVAGDVVPATDTEPTSFQGVLVEVLTWVDGNCEAYLPEPIRACAARYTLRGAP